VCKHLPYDPPLPDASQATPSSQVARVRCAHSSQHSRDAVNYDRILALITSEIILNRQIYGRMDELAVFRYLNRSDTRNLKREKEKKKNTQLPQ